ncbi:B3 domain-containing protein [Dichanthelium oligosanthes]|uniref:B3 domain-containing protein n=1 Tax=Dichanthelium oligosanthes TaxID=888268 RepID=A0A1E5UZ55_9POAL|nr:B3 domain-containing protein [Dichanthelium oligosanthes]
MFLNSNVKKYMRISVVMARSGGSRMKKPCDCCKRYLDHLDEKNQNMSCFLRRMTANYKYSIIVPNRFLKHFAGELSGTIKLKSPNGSLYDVEVVKRFNKVVLQHGWEAFVDAHGIEEHDFLLFCHIEKSCFEVLIFDSVGCEKFFSCAGIRNTPNFQEGSVNSFDISSSSHHETAESSGSKRFVMCQKGNSCHRVKTAKMAAISSSSEESEDSPSENKSCESDDLQTPPRADYVLLPRSYLSEAQEERVIALIQDIQPECTVFVAVMQKSHVEPPSPYLVRSQLDPVGWQLTSLSINLLLLAYYSWLLVKSLTSCSMYKQAISKAYARAHFPHESTNVTLQRPGKSKKWHLKFCKRKDRVSMLRGQWLDFVHDNHVHEGDICLLFPTKGGRRFTFTVYLHRATATSCRGGASFQRVSSCHGRSRTKMASLVPIKEESTDGENASSESDMHESSHDSPRSDSSGPSEPPPYIVPSKSCLSQSQKNIVEEKALAIQSEVPIFVAIMKNINVYHMVEFGTRFAAPHLPHIRQTVLLQCMNKIWKTEMVIRSGRKRWFLIGGWSTFARDNGLRVGDICLFELKKNEGELIMKVHIISRERFYLESIHGCGLVSDLQELGTNFYGYLDHLDEKNQPMTYFFWRMDANAKNSIALRFFSASSLPVGASERSTAAFPFWLKMHLDSHVKKYMRISVVMARSGGSRMKKPCECCKRYLDHLDEKNQPMSCFFRLMDANSKHSMVSLIMPDRFVKRFAGKLSGRIDLESPNGSLYVVQVTERYSKTVLQRGWEAFVDANHIQENDFVLFRHIEKSRFEVLILDSDGCEKVFPYAGVRNTPCIQEQSLDSVDISSSSCHNTTESSGSERFARRQRSSSCHRGRTAKMAATSSSFEESGYTVKLVEFVP